MSQAALKQGDEAVVVVTEATIDLIEVFLTHEGLGLLHELK